MSGILFLIFRIVMALVLYSFLGFSIYTLWRELQLQISRQTEQKAPQLIINATNDDQFKVANFTKPEILIGREAGCDFTIPDATVSGFHARLAYHHKQWWIEDLQSTNGTFINGEKITSPTVIISDDEIMFGKSSFIINIQES